jgi:hypothetical protein
MVFMTARRMLTKMAGRLPVLKYKGKYWYDDGRLREIRNINDFSDSVQYADVDRTAIEEYDISWEEAQKHETWQKDFQ